MRDRGFVAGAVGVASSSIAFVHFFSSSVTGSASGTALNGTAFQC